MRDANGKAVAKGNLPTKVCVVCSRPFTWRKKWEKCWDEVTCCSDSCKRKRKSERKANKADDAETKAARCAASGERTEHGRPAAGGQWSGSTVEVTAWLGLTVWDAGSTPLAIPSGEALDRETANRHPNGTADRDADGMLRACTSGHPRHGKLASTPRTDTGTVAAAIDALTRLSVSASEVVLWGRSLGCALAQRQAARRLGLARAVPLFGALDWSRTGARARAASRRCPARATPTWTASSARTSVRQCCAL